MRTHVPFKEGGTLPLMYSANHGAMQNLAIWFLPTRHLSRSSTVIGGSSSGAALLNSLRSRSSSSSYLVIWPSSSSSSDVSISIGESERSRRGEFALVCSSQKTCLKGKGSCVPVSSRLWLSASPSIRRAFCSSLSWRRGRRVALRDGEPYAHIEWKQVRAYVLPPWIHRPQFLPVHSEASTSDPVAAYRRTAATPPVSAQGALLARIRASS